ncbi:MAG: hypothetical protein ABS41_03865 [Arenimonas sp. SCN 70-307]|nr:MAG: hypothetical protein ABS41_03865 [Arenimonas sp. SCN 70-307]
MDTHGKKPLAVLIYVDADRYFFGLPRKALERSLEAIGDLVSARVEDSCYLTTVVILVHGT